MRTVLKLHNSNFLWVLCSKTICKWFLDIFGKYNYFSISRTDIRILTMSSGCLFCWKSGVSNSTTPHFRELRVLFLRREPESFVQVPLLKILVMGITVKIQLYFEIKTKGFIYSALRHTFLLLKWNSCIFRSWSFQISTHLIQMFDLLMANHVVLRDQFL